MSILTRWRLFSTACVCVLFFRQSTSTFIACKQLVGCAGESQWHVAFTAMWEQDLELEARQASRLAARPTTGVPSGAECRGACVESCKCCLGLMHVRVCFECGCVIRYLKAI